MWRPSPPCFLPSRIRSRTWNGSRIANIRRISSSGAILPSWRWLWTTDYEGCDSRRSPHLIVVLAGLEVGIWTEHLRPLPAPPPSLELGRLAFPPAAP